MVVYRDLKWACEVIGYILFILLCIGISSGRKFCGGAGVPLKKGRLNRLTITNVATEISPAQEQVIICCFTCHLCIMLYIFISMLNM